MQGENKRQRKKKKMNENTYNISSMQEPAPGVTKTFLEVSRCSRAKQRQRNVQKKCAAPAKLLYCYLDILLFFTVLRLVLLFFTVLRRLALHGFINIIESFACSPG